MSSDTTESTTILPMYIHYTTLTPIYNSLILHKLQNLSSALRKSLILLRSSEVYWLLVKNSNLLLWADSTTPAAMSAHGTALQGPEEGEGIAGHCSCVSVSQFRLQIGIFWSVISQFLCTRFSQTIHQIIAPSITAWYVIIMIQSMLHEMKKSLLPKERLLVPSGYRSH